MQVVLLAGETRQGESRTVIALGRSCLMKMKNMLFMPDDDGESA